jgi:uncharacterized protein (DUF1501 family)
MLDSLPLLHCSVVRSPQSFLLVSFPTTTHHFSEAVKAGLSTNFGQLDEALTYFKDEMVAQGLWQSVTLFVASDFGRTLTANSGAGSDHGGEVTIS